ncbi:SgcJ/EcaC family oxidoreductase [Sorangium sp. So ce1036]|uniref:SgcJ/EcaC family oxidoreductase n=1 Tax=Sorangium sp. So ce1036 TaxID=3133328 RepID=UPI003F11015B
MHRALAALALPLSVLACAPASPPPVAPATPAPATPAPATPAPAAEPVMPDARAQQAMGEQLVAAFNDTWNRHDMDAFAALHAEDADFVNIFGLWWHGRPAIRESHVGIHKTVFRQSRLSSVRVETRFVAPDIAVVRWAWELTGVLSPEGQPVPDMQGILVHVARREGDRLRIVSTQNTQATADAFRAVRGMDRPASPPP